MERDSVGKDFDALLTVEKVQVVQTVSVQHLESILGKINRDLALLAAGPSYEDVHSLRNEISVLKSEVERVKNENRLQFRDLTQKQVRSSLAMTSL